MMGETRPKQELHPDTLKTKTKQKTMPRQLKKNMLISHKKLNEVDRTHFVYVCLPLQLNKLTLITLI